MDWTDFLTALGLAAAMEGAVYAIAPDGAKRAYLDFFTLPVETRRKMGVGVLAFGVLLVWLARS